MQGDPSPATADASVATYCALLQVTEAIASYHDLGDLFRELAQRLPQVLPFSYIAMILKDPVRNVMRVQILEAPHPRHIKAGLELPVDQSSGGWVWQHQQPLICTDLTKETRFPKAIELIRSEGIQSFCMVPLTTARNRLGTLAVGSTVAQDYDEGSIELLKQVAKQVAVAVENALAFQQIAELKDKLTKEKLYLEDEIRTEHNFEEIIGDSPALKEVLKQVEIVAPTDSTVLIMGETGTGKELLARAIHNRSSRRGATFVKMNCAAIPTGLLESELFGHERGAFTGAIAQKIGRFELADRGTLFLDEVGDIPLELQSKLLRVLQEQEFERLGNTKTVKVNVRLVAATNRDLTEMVADKLFRSDLYYRLNVFPIFSPALRERREDIPLLVRYFTQRFALRMNKGIEKVPSHAMGALTRYEWPGNVRELENFIERAVILSPGAELYVPVSDLKTMLPQDPEPSTALADAEREHILRTLKATNWVIGGPGGAAAKLDMKRTTLQSKMQELGIARPQ